MENPNSATITLNVPIKTSDKPIGSFTMRKPSAGELRGVKLFDMMQGDTAAYIEVLPRVTNPALTKGQAASLDLSDILQVMEKVGDWFAGKSESTPAA
ncbi:phage tail assembly protein [Psychrobacter sp.]|uniref:phage tail assembly protein n=1 Tax=Psychrobacter sp. TaxID=56811 RepID=UPI003BB05DFA